MRVPTLAISALLLTLPAAAGAAASIASEPRSVSEPSTDPNPEDAVRRRVMERLRLRLSEVVNRWDRLPSPTPQPSEQEVQRALGQATEEEHKEALSFTLLIARATTEQKERLIEGARKARALREIELWMPGIAAQQASAESPSNAAKFADAWLYLGAEVGRRDVLASAAAFSLGLLADHLDPDDVLPLSQRWLDRAGQEAPGWALSLLWASHATCLQAAGRDDDARRARERAAELRRSRPQR